MKRMRVAIIMVTVTIAVFVPAGHCAPVDLRAVYDLEPTVTHAENIDLCIAFPTPSSIIPTDPVPPRISRFTQSLWEVPDCETDENSDISAMDVSMSIFFSTLPAQVEAVIVDPNSIHGGAGGGGGGGRSYMIPSSGVVASPSGVSSISGSAEGTVVRRRQSDSEGEIPEPASGLLLLVGGISLLRKHRSQKLEPRI